ncbi:MAG: GTPase ObgE [Nitrospirae bacterium]|nr:GTPase ObgE [Nitrospirota bacterium]
MQFVDQVKIYVRAGDGGRGCISFRREKYVPRGGPDGGDGGKGGDIVLMASTNLNTLLDQRYQQQYTLKRGGDGRGKNQYGENSPDLIINVPVGTLVKGYNTGEVIADLIEEGQKVIAAKGGRGGKGNAFFKTATRQAPRFAQPGEKGEEKELLLELKLLADVGIVGLPNAGKSTFISVVSAARPKIAGYPFTTLVPHLGVVKVGQYRSFVIADIPGLIEGAHKGKGLGFQFLRHIERTSVLLHLVDISEAAAEDPVKDFEAVNSELRLYNPELIKKPMIVGANKIDAKGAGERLKMLKDYCKEKGLPFFPISAATGEGVPKLLSYLSKVVVKLKGKKTPPPSPLPQGEGR